MFIFMVKKCFLDMESSKDRFSFKNINFKNRVLVLSKESHYLQFLNLLNIRR